MTSPHPPEPTTAAEFAVTTTHSIAAPRWEDVQSTCSGNGREGIHDTLREMSKERTLLLHEVFGTVA